MKSEFQRLIDKVITDKDFRKKFINKKTRDEAVEKMGIDVDKRLKDALEDLDIRSIKRVAVAIEGSDFC